MRDNCAPGGVNNTLPMLRVVPLLLRERQEDGSVVIGNGAFLRLVIKSESSRGVYLNESNRIQLAERIQSYTTLDINLLTKVEYERREYIRQIAIRNYTDCEIALHLLCPSPPLS